RRASFIPRQSAAYCAWHALGAERLLGLTTSAQQQACPSRRRATAQRQQASEGSQPSCDYFNTGIWLSYPKAIVRGDIISDLQTGASVAGANVINSGTWWCSECP